MNKIEKLIKFKYLNMKITKKLLDIILHFLIHSELIFAHNNTFENIFSLSQAYNDMTQGCSYIIISVFSN